MKTNQTLIIAAVLVIAALIGGFFAGMQYQKLQTRTEFAARSGTFGGQNFGSRMGGQNANFAPVRGQVLSIGNNSITVKEQNGSSKIIVLSSSTTFVKPQNASFSDLKQGDTVMVLGTTNSDGSLTAQDVQINPEQFRLNGTPPANR